MAPTKDEGNYRQVPDNGHCLFLIESNSNQRTFRDYPNLQSCLADIDLMVSEYRREAGLGFDDHDFETVCNWLDEFRNTELMIYDREINRYKSVKGDEMKKVFLDQIVKAAEPHNGNEKFDLEEGEISDDSVQEEWNL